MSLRLSVSQPITNRLHYSHSDFNKTTKQKIGPPADRVILTSSGITAREPQQNPVLVFSITLTQKRVRLPVWIILVLHAELSSVRALLNRTRIVVPQDINYDPNRSSSVGVEWLGVCARGLLLCRRMSPCLRPSLKDVRNYDTPIREQQAAVTVRYTRADQQDAVAVEPLRLLGPPLRGSRPPRPQNVHLNRG